MFKNLSYSLADMLGKDYLESIIEANCFFDAKDRSELEEYAYGKVDFYLEADQIKGDEMLEKVGTQVVKACENNNEGAPTDSYRHAFNKNASPLTCHGCYRIGDDYKVSVLGKS